MWKEAYSSVGNNRLSSMGHIGSLLKSLRQSPGKFKPYSNIIKEQLLQNVIEEVQENDNQKM